jgi:glycosyltransferase involved in cell wall biosynthesis
MTDSVGVVIGTFGELHDWWDLAHRAFRSAKAQTNPTVKVIWVHGTSLREARNRGVEIIGTKYVTLLDADDEISPGYASAMVQGGGDIRRPSIVHVHANGREDQPQLLPKRDLHLANYIVIGAMVRRDLFLEAGGFDDYPVLEDWALWGKLVLQYGATVEDHPGAIYRIHVRENSRNEDSDLHTTTAQIIRANFARL